MSTFHFVVVVVLVSLNTLGIVAQRVLPALGDFLGQVLPLVSDRANKRAVRLARAKRK